MKSEKLKSILLCTKVLELAEVPFRVEPVMPAEALVEELVVTLPTPSL